MGEFNLKKFNKARLEPRSREVKVAELAEYFEGEGEPVWVVRGLDGEELYHIRNCAQRDQLIAGMITSLAGSTSDKIDAVKELFGVGDGVTEEYAKRIEILLVGSVRPKLDRQEAVRLLRNFPTVAGKLTDTILELTGLGCVPGKLKGSGETPASETP